MLIMHGKNKEHEGYHRKEHPKTIQWTRTQAHQYYVVSES